MTAELSVGDVVQIDPDKVPKFAGCFLVVEVVKDWGILGYVNIPSNCGTDMAPLRLKTGDFVRIGKGQWV